MKGAGKPGDPNGPGWRLSQRASSHVAWLTPREGPPDSGPWPDPGASGSWPWPDKMRAQAMGNMKRAKKDLEASLLARTRPDSARELKRPQDGELGSEGIHRPLSARDAFRHVDSGKRLHKRTMVCPNVTWALRIGVSTKPVPMYPNLKGYKEEDPIENLRVATKKLCEAKQTLDRTEALKKAAVEYERKKDLEGAVLVDSGEKKSQAKVRGLSIDSVNQQQPAEMVALEKGVLNLSRSLERDLAKLRSNRVVQPLDEAEKTAVILKTCVMPMLASRIQKLEGFRVEMIRDRLPEIKENEWSLPRGLPSYEAEIESRKATLKQLEVDLEMLAKHILEAKRAMKRGALRKTDSSSMTQSPDLAQDSPDEKNDPTGTRPGSRPASRTGSSKSRAGSLGRPCLKPASASFLPRNKPPTAIQSKAADGVVIVVGTESDEMSHEFREVVVGRCKSDSRDDRMEGLEQLQRLLTTGGSDGVALLQSDEARDCVLSCVWFFDNLVRSKAMQLVTKLVSRVPVQRIIERQAVKGADESISRNEMARTMRDRALVARICKKLSSPISEIRATAIKALSLLVWNEDAEYIPQIRQCLTDTEATVRLAAVLAIGHLATGRASQLNFQALSALAQDEDWNIRAAICEVLPAVSGFGRLNNDEAAGELDKDDKSKEAEALKEKISATEHAQAKAPVVVPKPSKRQHSSEQRSAAATSAVSKFQRGILKVNIFNRIDAPRQLRGETVAILQQLADDSSWNIRRVVLQVLAKLPLRGQDYHQETIGTFLQKLEDPSAPVRRTAFTKLPKIVSTKDSDYDGVVDRLLEHLDPNTSLTDHGRKKPPFRITPDTREEFRHLVVDTLVAITGKGNVKVMSKICKLMEHPDLDLRCSMISSLDRVYAPIIEDNVKHKYDPTIEVLIRCLSESNDYVRDAAVPAIQNLCTKDNINQITSALFRLLGAEDHGVRTSAVSVLLYITPMPPEGKHHMKKQLRAIAFGGESAEDGEIKNAEREGKMLAEVTATDQKALDGMVNEEENVSQGVCFILNKNCSGFEASHWGKRFHILKKTGDLLSTSAKAVMEGRAPKLLLNVNKIVKLNRTSFGFVVPFAVTIELEAHSKVEKDEPPVIIGFYNREEQGLWIEDMDETFRKLAEEKMRANDEHQRGTDVMLKPKDSAPMQSVRGMTERALDEILEAHEVKISESKELGQAEKIRADMTDRLERMVNDKTIFRDFAAGPTKEKVLDLARKEKEISSNNKMDMPELLRLLKAQSIIPHPLITQKLILECFKQANKPSGGARTDDKDALQLDFEEFRAFIRILGTRLGCHIKADDPALRIVVKQEVKDVLKASWNSRAVFQTASATIKAADVGARRMSDVHRGDSDMDLREFIMLLEKLGVCPEPLNKAVAAKLFKDVNVSEVGDSDSHSLDFEEYKLAMLSICAELGVPIIVNGRNLAEKKALKLSTLPA